MPAVRWKPSDLRPHQRVLLREADPRPAIQEPQAGETADQKEPLIAEGDADKTSQVDMAGTTKNELSAWKTRVDEWNAQKADSALLSQLESRLAKAATLSSQGDLSGALSELERIKPIAEQIPAPARPPRA